MGIKGLGLVLCLAGCVPTVGVSTMSSSSSSSSSSSITITSVTADIDASAPAGQLAPLWGDHYDLSFHHLNYTTESGFIPAFKAMGPRTVRCSTGRWEIGLPAPSGANSTNTTTLQLMEREFYRGGNNMVDADDISKYDFTWLDQQLGAVMQSGAVPFLCFDYMPFTLSSEQNPGNANNLAATNSAWSYANGIRTAPPATPAVYARVVRNVIRHVRGHFGGATDFGVTHVEIGNEPDLVDGSGQRLKLFWTGSASQYIAMYNAIAQEVSNDALISTQVQLGGGSFAFQANEPAPTYLSQFLSDVAANGTRCDFLSYHSYSDDPTDHFTAAQRANQAKQLQGLGMPLVNAEWGRALNGDDPVYDTLEHGIFRYKAMVLMQLNAVQYAHEALVRDVASTGGNLGLLGTGPVRAKPVADVYAALSKFNGATDALLISVPQGQYVQAGRTLPQDRIVVAWACDDPGAGKGVSHRVRITNLPWGTQSFTARRYLVSDATNAAGQGVKLDRTVTAQGGSFTDSVLVFGGAAKFYVWELTP